MLLEDSDGASPFGWVAGDPLLVCAAWEGTDELTEVAIPGEPVPDWLEQAPITETAAATADRIPTCRDSGRRLPRCVFDDAVFSELAATPPPS